MALKKDNKKPMMLPDRAKDLRLELARKIASFMGSEQNRATGIPGVTLHRRIAPTAPCSMTYEPGVTVMAQGQKRVDLGPTTFIYGESRYLLTSVDLPIVSQIVEASVQVPCPAMSLKLEMPVVRELLRHDRHARTIGGQLRQLNFFALRLKSDTKAPTNSIANTAACSGNHQYATSKHFERQTSLLPAQSSAGYIHFAMERSCRLGLL